MADIGVYTRKEVLDHKLKDGKKSEGKQCYWQLPRQPEFPERCKLWFAINGRWAGYFIIDFMDYNEDAILLYFYSESWHEFNGGERKPFQGFTYNVPKEG